MDQVHIFFFPMMASGHMIPTLDMAKLFVYRGAKATVITTPLNVPYLTKAIQQINLLGIEIAVRAIPFPAAEAGLPEGLERMDQLTSDDLSSKFFKATALLQEPLEQLLRDSRPNALVADMFFPWATDAAAKFGIPRLVFHGIGYFALCAAENVRSFKPHNDVSSDFDPFLVPDLPHRIELTRSMLPHHDREESETYMTKLLQQVKESESRSYGVIVNSVYEIEPEYAEYYTKVLGKKSWHIGPLLLCNTKIEEQKGITITPSSEKRPEILKWLDTKEPSSVIYVCFGSMSHFTDSLLYEIADGLEKSGQQFIWVVRKDKTQDKEENWLPEGFEERLQGKGIIVRGWAPQVLILDHEATGAFVTHCGWNSTLEGICAGVPMVTWPMFAEQFYNEKLLTRVLEVGVEVGAKEWSKLTAAADVKAEAVATAVRRVMVGEEADGFRTRARRLKDKALNAIEPGGSSYSALDALLKDLSTTK